MANVRFAEEGRPYYIASIQINHDTEITFYRNKINHDEYGVEVYTGKNYVVGSNKRSYSRVYKRMKNLPPKYKIIASKLIAAHNRRWPT